MRKLLSALCFIGASTLAAPSVQAVTLSGSFTYDQFTAVTLFPPFSQTVPSGTATFTFNTVTNTGIVQDFGNPALTGTILTGAGNSTFINDLFDDFVASFIFSTGLNPVDPADDIVIRFVTNFGGLGSGINTPFTITTFGATQFVTASGNINSFAQAVPFEFSPVLGLVAVGGFMATKKVLKARSVKK